MKFKSFFESVFQFILDALLDIDEFIEKSPKDKQEEYNNVLRGLTGTFR